MNTAQEKAAQGDRVRFRTCGFRFNNKFYLAPILKNLHKKMVTVSKPRVIGAGLEVVKVFYQGQYVTDAFNDIRVPCNKRLMKRLQECEETQTGLYL